MTGVNKVILVGNLGRDPEIRRNQAGDPIANLSIATSERWKDKQTGERREKTEWHRVVSFNKNLNDVIEKYVKRGSKIYIEGKLQTRKWQAQDGSDRYSTEVVLDWNATLTLLDKRSDSAPASDTNDMYDDGREIDDGPAPDSHLDDDDLDDDSIPF